MIDDSVRKQVYELTLDDLEQCAIWEFALDEEDIVGQDEATVRPRPERTAYHPEHDEIGLAVVRATFRCADGTQLLGYVTPARRGADIADMQPVVVMQGGQVPLWLGQGDDATEGIARAYAMLGKPSAAVFPLEFAPEIDAPTSDARGRIEGFAFRDGDSTLQFKR